MGACTCSKNRRSYAPSASVITTYEHQVVNVQSNVDLRFYIHIPTIKMQNAISNN